MRILTLTTDFATRDWYVAALQGVVATRLSRHGVAPTFVHVSHDVPPGDVETASFLLAAAAPTFPEGTVHLAVVDPGVGSDRRILAASVDCWDAGDREWRRQLFVAPDNGLLLGVLRGDVERSASKRPSAPVVVAVDRPELWRRAPGATFHGRDRFAPLAAMLLDGATLASLGRPIETDSMAGDPHPAPTREGATVRGRVRHVDRFGNLITDIPAHWLDDSISTDDTLAVVVDGRRRVVSRVSHYLEIPADGSAAGALVGSLGTLELSSNAEDLAALWAVPRGALVEVHVDSSTRDPSTR